MKYAFIQTNAKQCCVTTMAEQLQVSTSNYYRWLKQPISKRDKHYVMLDQLICKIFWEHQERYGAVRINEELKAVHGISVKRQTISTRMKFLGLVSKARRKFKLTTNFHHDKPIADNLLKQDFSTTAPNQKWVTDITYIATAQGWLYLCVVIDLYARKVIGWSMSKRIKQELVCAALLMTLWHRGFPKGVIVHSDRGSQYCAKSYQQLMKQHNLLCSMSGKGCCYDNAPCESFFHTLKVELVHDEKYHTRSQAKASIFEYIEAYYNNKRRHSAINYMTPNQFDNIIDIVKDVG